jgi:branched-chain amino acid transport system permease protein
MRRDYQIFAVFVFTLIIIPILIPQFEGTKHYIRIMVFVGIYSLITIGLNLLMGYAGQISVGHAAFFGLGAYASGVLTGRFGFNPWLALILAILITLAVAYFVGVPSLKLHGHYLAMATLAFGVIIFIVLNEWDHITGGPSGLPGIPKISLFGYKLDSDLKYYAFVWSIVVLSVIFSINLIHSRIGRALRSVHGSEDAAKAMGVNTPRVKIQVFIISALYASIAGSLYAHYMNFISPSTFNLFFSIKLLIMVVLGGTASIWGGILGAFVITYLSNEWLSFLAEFEFITFGMILLLMTIFLPDGIFGIIERFGLGRNLSFQR